MTEFSTVLTGRDPAEAFRLIQWAANQKANEDALALADQRPSAPLERPRWGKQRPRSSPSCAIWRPANPRRARPRHCHRNGFHRLPSLRRSGFTLQSGTHGATFREPEHYPIAWRLDASMTDTSRWAD